MLTRHLPRICTRIAAVSGLALLLQAPGALAFELKGEPKIAFIYASSARDGGWNESLDNARQIVAEQLGYPIAVAESIPEEASALKNAIDLYVQRGFNIIVTTTYGYSDGVLEAANKYPNVAFLAASGTTNAANLESFYARTYQAWYLAGIAAGFGFGLTGLLHMAAQPERLTDDEHQQQPHQAEHLEVDPLRFGEVT